MSNIFKMTMTVLMAVVCGGQFKLEAVYNVTVDGAGNLYVPDLTTHQVFKIDPQGVTVVVAGAGRAGFFGDGGQASA